MVRPMARQMAAIPTRHGRDLDSARRHSEGLRKALPGDPAPDAETWQAMGEALLVGDPQIDRLIDWMMAEGFRDTKAMFDRAAAAGIDAVPDAPAPLRTFFERVEATPAWVDATRIEAGIQANALAGRIGNHVLRDGALIGGYRLSAVNKTLLATGALEKGAVKRLVETTKWWIDCTRPGGMDKFAAGYRSTLQVRLIHGLVRRHVAKMPGWDSEADGLPVNQADMHITYLGFSVFYIIGARVLGIPLSNDERQAIMDLWRYIAWLLGVEERWLHRTELSGLVALYQNGLSQPGPDQDSRRLAGALTDEPLHLMRGPLRSLRGRWSRAVHLSIVRTFVGKEGMVQLGLPPATPWYLLTALPRLLRHKITRMIPGGRALLVRRGLAQQQRELDMRIDGEAPSAFAPDMLATAGQ
jgi:hypothetical protein